MGEKLPGIKFFSTETSPTNWCLNKAIKLQEDKRRGASVAMREVAVPSNFPSAGKNLINFIVKVPVGLFAITIGQIPAVKRKTWDNLEKVHLVSSSLGKTLLDLAIHVYKAIMFLTFSPIWCFTVGTFSPKFCKTVLDKMHLTKSEGPQQENPKTEADSTEVPLSSDSQASQSSETQQASQSNSDVSGADQAPSSQQTMTANSINHTVLRMNAENKDQSQEQNEAQGQENKKEMRKSVIQQKPASHSTSSANRLSMKPMQSGLSFLDEDLPGNTRGSVLLPNSSILSPEAPMPPPPPSAINPPPPPAPSGLPTPSKTAVAAAFTMSASDLNKGLKKVSDEERAKKNVTKEPTALASLRNLKGFELAQQKANSRVSHRYSVVVVNEIDEWNKDEKFEQILKDVETVNFLLDNSIPLEEKASQFHLSDDYAKELIQRAREKDEHAKTVEMSKKILMQNEQIQKKQDAQSLADNKQQEKAIRSDKDIEEEQAILRKRVLRQRMGTADTLGRKAVQMQYEEAEKKVEAISKKDVRTIFPEQDNNKEKQLESDAIDVLESNESKDQELASKKSQKNRKKRKKKKDKKEAEKLEKENNAQESLKSSIEDNQSESSSDSIPYAKVKSFLSPDGTLSVGGSTSHGKKAGVKLAEKFQKAQNLS